MTLRSKQQLAGTGTNPYFLVDKEELVEMEFSFFKMGVALTTSKIGVHRTREVSFSALPTEVLE